MEQAHDQIPNSNPKRAGRRIAEQDRLVFAGFRIVELLERFRIVGKVHAFAAGISRINFIAAIFDLHLENLQTLILENGFKLRLWLPL